MLRAIVHVTLSVAALAVASHVEFDHSSEAQATKPHRANPYRRPVRPQIYPSQMFSNYYVGPACRAGGVPAQLYTSPLPTPPLVGHTYITYQPLRPHEFMYHHKRTYYRHNQGEGWSKTTVRYW